MTALYQNWNNGSSTEQYATAMQMLERAEADNVLDVAVEQVKHDRNAGRSVRMARWAIPATNTTSVTEGVNNATRAIVAENVFVTINEYAETFAYSSQAEDMDPLDYSAGVAEVGYDLVKLDRTEIQWAAMCAGTQVAYNSSSLSSRNTVNGVVTAGRIDQVITILRSAKAKTFSDLKLGSNKVGSSGLQASYIAFGHEHLRPDFEKLPGWLGANNYPSDYRLNPYEAGSLASGRVRVILSPELKPFQNAGALRGSANLRSTGGVNVDVYPIVIVGKSAFSTVSLKGKRKGGLGNLETYKIDTPDRSDPANLTRYWSARWLQGDVITNELWICRLEVACTAAYN